MRPPSASDVRPARRLRITYIKKHAPYNAGEDRVVAEEVARKLCILGVAVPSAKNGPEDQLGGWGLTADQSRIAQEIKVNAKVQAGDFADEIEDAEKAREAEEARTTGKGGDEKKETAKKGGFRKGKKKDGEADSQ